MKQTKFFEGTINGEKFDNVHAYNTRMTELISAGVTNIEASSSTSIRMVDDTLTEFTTGIGGDTPVCACEEDSDLSFYPYFEVNDPKYLDLLVTNDAITNAKSLKEMTNVLDKCHLYIAERLYDADEPTDTKKQYLEGVRRIISDIICDNTNTSTALSSIDRNRAKAASDFRAAQAAFAEAQHAYNKALRECDDHQFILQAAKPVIARLLEFYRGIEAEALGAIAETRERPFENTTECKKCPTCGECESDCTCDPKVVCNVKEVSPQQLSDISNWFDRVLHACGL